MLSYINAPLRRECWLHCHLRSRLSWSMHQHEQQYSNPIYLQSFDVTQRFVEDPLQYRIEKFEGYL